MTVTVEESDSSMGPHHPQDQHPTMEEAKTTSSSSSSSGPDESPPDDSFVTKLDDNSQHRFKSRIQPPDSPTCSSATSSGLSSLDDGRCGVGNYDNDDYFVLHQRLGRVIPTSDNEEADSDHDHDDVNGSVGNYSDDDTVFDDCTSDDEENKDVLENGNHDIQNKSGPTTSSQPRQQRQHHRRVLQRPSDARRFSTQQQKQQLSQREGILDLNQKQILREALEQLNRFASLDSEEYQQRLLENSLPSLPQLEVSSLQHNKATPTTMSPSSSKGGSMSSFDLDHRRIDQNLSTPLVQLSMSLHRLHSVVANLTKEADGHSEEMVSLQKKLCTSQQRTKVLEGAIQKLHKRNIKLKRKSELNKQVATQLTHQVQEHVQQLEDQTFQLMASKVHHHEIHLQLLTQQQQQQLYLQQQQQSTGSVSSVCGRERLDSTFSELVLEEDDEYYTSAGYEYTTTNRDSTTISVETQSVDSTTTKSIASARTEQQRQLQHNHNPFSKFEDVPPSLRISMHGSSITSHSDSGRSSSQRQRTWSGFSTTSTSSNALDDVVVSSASVLTGGHHNDRTQLCSDTNVETASTNTKNGQEVYVDENNTKSTKSKHQTIHSFSTLSSSNGESIIKEETSQINAHRQKRNPFALFLGPRTEQTYTVKMISPCNLQFVALPTGSMTDPPRGNEDSGVTSITMTEKSDDGTLTAKDIIKEPSDHLSATSLSSQLMENDGCVPIVLDNNEDSKNSSSSIPESFSLGSTPRVTNTLDGVDTTVTTEKQSVVFAVCGFKGFDDITNLKPTSGSRLLAINGIDVSPQWTLEELYEELKLVQGSGTEIASEGNFMTLTFHIETWNREQNDILMEAIARQQKNTNLKLPVKKKESLINVAVAGNKGGTITCEGQTKNTVTDKSRCEHDKLLHHPIRNQTRSSTDSVGKAFSGIGNFFQNLHQQHDKSSTTKPSTIPTTSNGIVMKSPLERDTQKSMDATKCQESVEESIKVQVVTATVTVGDIPGAGTLENQAVGPPNQCPAGGIKVSCSVKSKSEEDTETASSCGNNKSEKQTNNKVEITANPIDNVLAFFAHAIQ
jgi:hypothetical protein